MDRIERVITLLQAIVSTGDVAETTRRQIARAGEPLTSNPAFTAQVPMNIDRFIDGAVAVATAKILSSGGDLTTVGHVIGGATGHQYFMLDSPLKYLAFLISLALVLGIPVGVILGALGIQPLALASIPELPGVRTQGATRDEARSNVLDALRLVLSVQAEKTTRSAPEGAIEHLEFALTA